MIIPNPKVSWQVGNLIAPVVELVYTTDLKSVAEYGLLVRVQPGAPNK